MKNLNLMKLFACFAIVAFIAGLNLKHAANDYGITSNSKLHHEVLAQSNTTNGDDTSGGTTGGSSSGGSSSGGSSSGGSSSGGSSSSDDSGLFWKHKRTEDTCTLTFTEGINSFFTATTTWTLPGHYYKCVDGWRMVLCVKTCIADD